MNAIGIRDLARVSHEVRQSWYCIPLAAFVIVHRSRGAYAALQESADADDNLYQTTILTSTLNGINVSCMHTTCTISTV